MAKPLRKALKKLKERQADFDMRKLGPGFKRPGSMNPHKQGAAGGTGKRR